MEDRDCYVGCMQSTKLTCVNSFLLGFNFENFAWVIFQKQSEKTFREDFN